MKFPMEVKDDNVIKMAIDSLEAAIGCVLVKSPENLCLNTKPQSPLMVMLVHPIASYVVIFFNI